MRWLGLLLCCLLSSMAWAQDEVDYRQIYREATEEYTIGHFDASLKLLEQSIDKFNGALKVSAYRLMSLCYLAKDNQAEAEQYATLLLKEAPYYNVSIYDPQRFVDMVERIKKGNMMTITTASQLAESPEEAPVPVTVITEEMIQASGAKTLADLLTLYVPGISIVEGPEMNVAVHGVYTSSQEKILIMLDGHRLNSRATNSEAPDYRTSLEKIQQIEVLRGPASSLYGNVALTAVVNIITKKGAQINGAKLSVSAGNNNTYRTDFLFGKGGFDFDFMGWASVYSSKGEKRSIDTDDEACYGKVLLPGTMYIGGYNHKPAYDIGFTAKWKNFKILFNTQYAKKVPSYVSVRYPSLLDYDRYRMINGAKPGRSRQATHGELSYEKSGKKWSGKVSIFADMESCSFYDVAGDTLVPNDRYLPIKPGEILDPDDIHKEEFKDLGEYGVYQVQAWNDYTYGGSAHAIYNFHKNRFKGNLLIGTQIENYVMKDNSMLIGDQFDRIIIEFADRNRSIYLGNELNLSVFAQLKTSIGDKFVFNGGLRYDYKHRYNGKQMNEVSPRLALIYHITPNSHLRLGYSHSFVDAPFFYRASTINTYAGGNKLEAEQMDALQLGFQQTLQETGLHYELNLYYNTLKDLIYFLPHRENGDVLTNAGSIKLCGIEGTLSYEKSRLYALLNLSYQHLIKATNYQVTGHHVNSVPDCLIRLLASYGVWQHNKQELRIRGNVAFQTAHYAPLLSDLIYRGENNIVSDPNYQIGARAIVNAGLDYRYRQISASLNVYNLFDTDYSQGGSLYVPIPQQGINYMLTLSYAF